MKEIKIKNKYPPEPVPCKYCKEPTNYTYTHLCNRCWELEHRIEGDFAIATEIYNSVKSKLLEEALNAQSNTNSI